MSNRKNRSAKIDFLYEMARHGYEYRADTIDKIHIAMLARLTKQGYLEPYRVLGRVNARGGRNYTRYCLTDKAYALLTLRSRGCNTDIRVHQHTNQIGFKHKVWEMPKFD